jgi:short subunit dehydrogenase-like uncharacterized protein
MSPTTQQANTREFQLVVFGATSFVGKLVCEYLLTRAPDLNWAMAARSQSKLDALRKELNCAQIPSVVADVDNQASIDALAARTQVMLSTVGPYALYGEPMVRACATFGTHYCDLTGEPQWIRLMLERHQDAAKASGALLIPASGFDSVPSDIGVYALQKEAVKRFGNPLESVQMRVMKIRGKASGGTIASLLNAIKEAAKSKAIRKELSDPYSLCAIDKLETHKTRQRIHAGASFDPQLKAWCAPFVMAPINTRVVLRSNALMHYRYGKKFRYDEAMVTGKGLLSGGRRAATLAAGTGALMVTAAFAPTRWLLEKVLPKPGEGPSKAERDNGSYELLFSGKSDEHALQLRFTAKGDPGYASTAKIVSEVAIALLGEPVKAGKGGFHTPASLLGDQLSSALQRHAEIKIRIE